VEADGVLLLLIAFLLVNALMCHLSFVLASVVQGDAVNCNTTLFEAWVARCSPNRFQSRSKKFWNRRLIKQYPIIVRIRLINTHIRIHYHFSTFSEYCERSTWQFGINVIYQKFWCVSYLFTW